MNYRTILLLAVLLCLAFRCVFAASTDNVNRQVFNASGATVQQILWRVKNTSTGVITSNSSSGHIISPSTAGGLGNFVYGSLPASTMDCWVQTNNVGSAWIKCLEDWRGFNNGELMTYTYVGPGSAPTNATYAATVKNPTLGNVIGYWNMNGGRLFTTIIAPGSSYTYVYVYDPTQAANFDFGYIIPEYVPNYADGDLGLVLANPETGVGGFNGTNAYSGGSNGTNDVTPPQDTWQGAATNGPINFAGASGDTLAKAGYNAIVAELQKANLELGIIDSHLSTSSNSVAVTVTNVSDSNLTNLLKQIANNQTNLPLENVEGLQRLGPGNIAGSATNATTAIAAGTAASQDALDGVDSIVDALGSSPLLGAGINEGMTIPFVGGIILDFDPAVRFPGVMPFIKALMTFLVLLAFCTHVSKLFYTTAQTYASAETGGVPDLEAEFVGIGGNALGVGVAVAVALAAVAIWVGLFTAFFSQITSHFTSLVSAGGSLTMSNNTAMYLLASCFPVDLILSLAWTRIVLYFAAGKLIIIAASASRFLWGK